MRGMSSHLMIDLETGGVHPDAAIFTIGACAFDIGTQDEIIDIFSIGVSFESNEAYGRRFEASTLEWWFKQSPEAQMALFEGEITNLKNALVKFRLWVDQIKPKVTHVWANDPDFDVVIIQDAFRCCGERWPFNFWQNRSVRTIGELAYPEKEELDNAKQYYRKGGTHHKAVDDAIAQARLVQSAYSLLCLRR